MKSADTVRRALDLRDDGWTHRAIADEVDVSTSSVSRWLKGGGGAITPSRALRGGDECPDHCALREVVGAEYAYLLGQYLGDGWIGSNWPRGVQRLEVSCCAAYPGIVAEVVDAIGAVLPLNVVSSRPRPGVALVAFVDGCERLGVEVKRMNRDNVSVNKRVDVTRLDEFVGAKY